MRPALEDELEPGDNSEDEEEEDEEEGEGEVESDPVAEDGGMSSNSFDFSL